MTPSTLSTFGRYEIIRKLGRSMTDVYLAFDPQEQRRAVLKIVEHSGDSFTQIVVEAERRGAAIQQQLHTLDRRILEVYETGDMNGCFFVAMQYAEGSSLAEMLQQTTRLDALRAARYAEDIASQLVTLHSFQVDVNGRKQAIVHGDIKPSNVQIGPRGEVWLLDFGIAKTITATRNLTQHNLGSPAYCSPERLRRGEVDPHADLWALGVCLYEMVAGLPPYHAQSTRKLENLIQSRKPPRALPENCPDALRAITRKALAADLEHRYSSASEMQADLRAFIDRRVTLAESQVNPAWDANATLQRDPPSRAATVLTSTPRRLAIAIPHFSRIAFSLLAGVLVGLLCFVPAASFYRFWRESAPLRSIGDLRHTKPADIDAAVRRYKAIEREGGIPSALSLISPLGQNLRSSLMQAGDEVLESYRNSSDADAEGFDWTGARHAFSRYLDLDPNSTAARAKRSIADGYLSLAHNPRAAEASFREAARLLPKSPDPRLGLARLSVYALHNMGQAMAEFHAAERLAYRPGPRELAQQADGFEYRAEQQLKAAQSVKAADQRRHLILLAQRDLQRARILYEPLAGYSNVNARMDRLELAEAGAQKLAEPPPQAKQVGRYKKPLARSSRRWR